MQDDLSEIEAFELDEELVEKYYKDSKLINKAQGGNVDTSFISTEWEEEHIADGHTIELDEDSFKKINREEQENVANLIFTELYSINEVLYELEEEGMDSRDNKLYDDADTVEHIISILLGITENFIKKRITWKKFRIGVIGTINQLEEEEWSDLDDQVEQYRLKAIDILEHAIPVNY